MLRINEIDLSRVSLHHCLRLYIALYIIIHIIYPSSVPYVYAAINPVLTSRPLGDKSLLSMLYEIDSRFNRNDISEDSIADLQLKKAVILCSNGMYLESRAVISLSNDRIMAKMRPMVTIVEIANEVLSCNDKVKNDQGHENLYSYFLSNNSSGIGNANEEFLFWITLYRMKIKENISMIDYSFQDSKIKNKEAFANISDMNRANPNSASISKNIIKQNNVNLLYKMLNTENNDSMFNKYSAIMQKDILFFILESTSNDRAYFSIFKKAIEILRNFMDKKFSQAELYNLKYYETLLKARLTEHGNANAKLNLSNEIQSGINDIIDLKNDSLENNIRLRLLRISLDDGNISDVKKISELHNIAVLATGSIYQIHALERLIFIYAKNKRYLEALRLLNKIYKWSVDYATTIKLMKYINKEIHNFFGMQDYNNEIINDKLKRDYINRQNDYKIMSCYFEFYQYIINDGNSDSYMARIVDVLYRNHMYKALISTLPKIINRNFQSDVIEYFTNVLIDSYAQSGEVKKAIKLLENSIPYYELYGNLALNRYIIHANTLFLAKEYTKMQSLLAKDFNIESDQIMARSYFVTGKWGNFDDYSEPYIYTLKASATLYDVDILRILRQEISYINQNKYSTMNLMMNEFNDRIAKVSSGNLAAVLDSSHAFFDMRGKYGIDGLQDPKMLRDAKANIVGKMRKSL